MADLFGRRAHASESSYSRDRDKEKLARLQEFLRKEGYHIPERPATAAASPALPTVDVLAEISAHSLPLGKVRVTQVCDNHTHARAHPVHLLDERRLHLCSTACALHPCAGALLRRPRRARPDAAAAGDAEPVGGCRRDLQP